MYKTRPIYDPHKNELIEFTKREQDLKSNFNQRINLNSSQATDYNTETIHLW